MSAAVVGEVARIEEEMKVSACMVAWKCRQDMSALLELGRHETQEGGSLLVTRYSQVRPDMVEMCKIELV